MNQKIETQPTITEKNEVIAKFEGYYWDESSRLFKKDDHPDPNWIGILREYLNYHESFEKLMPACQKFVKENWDNDAADKYVINVLGIMHDFLKGDATILDIHQALYEGIEWLNKQKKEV